MTSIIQLLLLLLLLLVAGLVGRLVT